MPALHRRGRCTPFCAGNQVQEALLSVDATARICERFERVA